MQRIFQILAADNISRRHIIKQAGQRLVIKKRQPVFHPQMFFAVGNRLINFIVFKSRTESLAIFASKRFYRIGIKHNFTHGFKTIRLKLAGRPLTHCIKSPDTLNLVAEQIDAQRLVRPDRKNINNITAHGIFPGLNHLFHPIIAVNIGIMQKSVKIQRLPDRHILA